MNPTSVQAQYYIGPANAGTAGAGRASVSPFEGPYMNPASLAHLNKYYIGASFFTDPDHQLDRERTWGVFVTDANPETIVSAAFGYISQHHDVVNFEGVDEQDFHLAVGSQIYPGVSLGVGGHHLIQDSATMHRLITNNMDAGLLVTPTPHWGLALVGYDLFSPNGDVPVVVRRETTYAVGVNYLFDTFLRVKADVVKQAMENPNARLAYMAGFESYVFPTLVVRLGYQRDELLDRKIYAGGLGFEGPKFSLDYAAQIVDGQGGARHYIDLWVSL